MVYHFDYRHNGALIRDDEGTALVSLDQAWEASQLAIEVRESGQLVLQVVLTVEIKQFR